MSNWKLKRTRQCYKCPWRKDTDPFDIPNGYCPTKHQNLQGTIATPGDISLINGGELRIMACHETHDSHCIGWLHNQLGDGNNVALRIKMLSCDNADKIQIVGEQHQSFEDTLPDVPRGTLP